MTRYSFLLSVVALSMALPAVSADAAQVVAFWGFADDYDFDTNPNKQDFAADVDNTVGGSANLQAFLGKEDKLDNNGGNGKISYTSPTSGITYDPTKTIKWKDLKGKGPEFDIDGMELFTVNKNDGAGDVEDLDFADDALMYITLDGSGYKDFEIRFDIEATPFTEATVDDPAEPALPTTFDIFYRVGGPTGTWYREANQNNISLSFMDYDPADIDNQFADSGMISLSSALNNSSTIEIIINDFAEFGNEEMEIDNIEIIATSVPEPTSLLLLTAAMACVPVARKR